jgi:hypothetical protein
VAALATDGVFAIHAFLHELRSLFFVFLLFGVVCFLALRVTLLGGRRVLLNDLQETQRHGGVPLEPIEGESVVGVQRRLGHGKGR